MSRPRCAQALLCLGLGAVLAGCPRPSGPVTELTLQLNTDGGAPGEAALAEARNIVQERLDQLGAGDAVVETAPGQRLRVRLTGVEDPERVQRLITQKAFLEMRLVRFPTGGESPASREAVLSHYNGQLPPELEILDEEVRDESGKVTGTRSYAVEKQPVITGRDLKAVQPTRSQFNQPIIAFQLKPEAAAAFGDATGANIGSLLAIVIDRRVVSAPRIGSRIGDTGIIEGGFTEEQVQDLVIQLRSGAPRGPLTVVDVRIEGPGGG